MHRVRHSLLWVPRALPTGARLAFGCWLALVLAASTTLARAQERDYADTIREALAEFESGHFEESLALFRVAHSLRPSARTLRGLGNCSFELRHYVDAVGYYESSLAATENPLTAEQRAEVEGLLGRARVFVGSYTLAITPAGATATIDGRAVTGTSLLLDIGEHSLGVTAPGHEARTIPITVRGAEVETLTVALVPVGGGAVASPPILVAPVGGGVPGGPMLGGGNRGVVGPPPVSVAAPAPADVHVRVESRTPDLVLHAAPADGSRSGFAPVCAAPCEATLRGGTYEMAISVGAGEPVPSMVGPIRLDHDTTLALEYQSADGLRVAGGVTLGVGLFVGLALVITPFAVMDGGYFLGAETNLAMFSVGIGLVVIAPITGLILLVQGDSISVRELAAGVRF